MIKSLIAYYVYIVECADASYYIGVTNNIESRVWEDNNNEDNSAYTYSRRPVVLKYVEFWEDINGAIDREKQLKGWSRKKKDALIKGKENKLPELAKGRKGYMNKKYFE